MADETALSGVSPIGAGVGVVGSVLGGILGNNAGAAARGEANNDMVVANQIIQELANAPDISKPLILEKYRQAGVLTPQMEQYISAGPSAAANVQGDQSSLDAQRQALQDMATRAQGGMTQADRAALAQAQAQSRSDEQAKQQQIIQQAQAQMGGAGASGASLAAKLMSSQSGANQEAANANQVAQMAQQNALQAASMQGQLGGQINQQLFGQGMQRAQAADEMNRFNTQNQIAQQQRNVSTANQAQASNLANAQNVGNMNTAAANNEQYNQLQRQYQQFQGNNQVAQMKAGSLQNMANFNMGQGNQQAQSMYNTFTGAGQALGGVFNGIQSQNNFDTQQANYNARTNAMYNNPYSGSPYGRSSGITSTSYDPGTQMIGYDGGHVHDYRNGGQVQAQHPNEKAVVPGDSPKNDNINAKLSEDEIVVPRSIAKSPLGSKLLDLIEKNRQVNEVKRMADGGLSQGSGDPGFDAFQQAHPNLDPTIAKTAYEYYKSKAPAQVQRAPAQNPDVYQGFAEQVNDPNRQNYADGGDVTDDTSIQEPTDEQVVDDSNDPMVQKYRQMGMINGPTVQTNEKANVTSKAAQPADLDDVSSNEDADDEELENKMADEDFEAGEKADKSDDRKVASNDDDSDEDDDSDDTRNLEGTTLNKDEALAQDKMPDVDPNAKNLLAGQDPNQSQSLTGLLAAMKPQYNALAEAQRQRDMNLAMAQVQRGAALMGAGMAKTDPSQAIANIADQEKYANLPVQKYDELQKNEQNDPTSNVSKVMRDYLSSKGMKVPENASAADLLKVAPFLAKDQALQNAMARAMMNITARHQEGEANRTNSTKNAQIRADAITKGQGRAQERQDQRLSGQVVQRINTDPIIKPSMQNLASLKKSQTILENTSVPLTPQFLSDAEQDVASALQIRGMGGTEGKIKRTEIITVNRLIAEAKQKYLNRPDIDLRKEDPKLVQQILKMNKAMAEDYETTIKQRKHELAQEFQPMAENSPRLQKTVNQYLGDAETPTQPPTQQAGPNEVARKTKDGKIAIFDSNTKQFLRYQ